MYSRSAREVVVGTLAVLMLSAGCAKPAVPVVDEPIAEAATEASIDQTQVCCESCTRDGCTGCDDASGDCPSGMFPAACEGEGEERVCRLPEVGKRYEVVVRNLCAEPVRYSITERFSSARAEEVRTLEPGADRTETLEHKQVLTRWYPDDRTGSEISHARGGLIWFTADCQAVGVAASVDAQTGGLQVPEDGKGPRCSSDCSDGSKLECSGDTCTSYGGGCSQGHDMGEDVRVYVDSLCPAGE